jgi:adenylate kinase
MKYRTFLLFGAPGSGKGTQGTALGRVPGFVHISTGDMFRNLKPGSTLHNTFMEYSTKGQLVPDEFTVELWREFVKGLIADHKFNPETDTLILDGIPRNVAQSTMMKGDIDVVRVYYLDCLNKEVLYQRLQKRAVLENRKDDASIDVVNNRLRVYEQETFPVLQQYPECIIRRIDTARTPIEVLADIVNDVAALSTAKEREPAPAG